MPPRLRPVRCGTLVPPRRPPRLSTRVRFERTAMAEVSAGISEVAAVRSAALAAAMADTPPVRPAAAGDSMGVGLGGPGALPIGAVASPADVTMAAEVPGQGADTLTDLDTVGDGWLVEGILVSWRRVATVLLPTTSDSRS